MKIFELQWTKQDEKSWIAADTIIHALKVYSSTTGVDLSDLDDDDIIIELPKEEWDKHFVKMDETDETATISFTDWILNNKEPDLICETIQ